MHSTKKWAMSRVRKTSYWKPWLRKNIREAGQLESLVGVWTCLELALRCGMGVFFIGGSSNNDNGSSKTAAAMMMTVAAEQQEHQQ